MAKRRKRLKKQTKRKDGTRIFKDIRSNTGVLILVALFLGSTIGYAFLSGGSLSIGGDAASGEPPENRQTAGGFENPYAVTQDFLDRGKDIYLRLCVGCHFEDGSGPTEHSIKEMAPHHTQGDYFWISTYGLVGTEMLGWKEALTPEERWQVVMYARRVLAGVYEEGEAHQEPQQPASTATIESRKSQPSMEELALKGDFDSLADGLKYTPEGALWAGFVNVKLITGTPLEEYARTRVTSDDFYGVKIIGMFYANYPDNTRIELHDVGYDEFNFIPRNSIGITNIVSVRPFIFGHTKNVNMVLSLLNNPSGQRTAYKTFRPLLDAMNESVGFVEIYLIDTPYSDMRYDSYNAVEDGVERVTAYRIKDISAIDLARYEKLKNSSPERGITDFEIIQKDDIFLIRLISSNLTALLSEEV
ncbi:MAG: c-type cytochrome [Candidatus Hydrothermarchaeaceae archaeon]